MYVEGILRQDVGWFDAAEHGSLTTRLVADTQLIAVGTSHHLGGTVTCFAQFVAGITISFVKGWRLALVTLAALPAMSIVAVIATMITQKSSIKIRGQSGLLSFHT